jgi:hypothetical protein
MSNAIKNNQLKWIIAFIIGICAFLLFNRYTIYLIYKFLKISNGNYQLINLQNDNLALTFLLSLILTIIVRCLLN